MRVPRARGVPGQDRPRPMPHQRPDPAPAAPAPAMSSTGVVHLQRTAGNRAVARSLQRAPEQESSTAPGFLRQPSGGFHALVPDSIEALSVKDKLLDRLVEGPVFSDSEIADLERQDPKWLRAIGTGSYAEAVAYATEGTYYDWLRLAPGKRLLIATVEWRKRLGRTEKSPAFTLGRHLDLRGDAVPAADRERVIAERDEQIKDAFVRTLAPAFEDDPLVSADDAKRNVRANTILSRIFLILQNGLKVYDDAAADHVDYVDGDVARALAHGGRVNIRIPALGADGPPPTALLDWLGVTENGVNAREKEEKRDYATHHMDISGTDEFEERGGMAASASNVLSRLSDEQVRMWGLPLAADGMGGHDFNGDVILPDNSHGHLLLIFTPPQQDQDGALQVGIETIGPGGKSPVGYRHNALSTEATANPESSFYGHKKDKIGGGRLKDNQRYVPLAELPLGWVRFLDEVKEDWQDRLFKAGDDLHSRRALYGELVGRRTGRFTPSTLGERSFLLT